MRLELNNGAALVHKLIGVEILPEEKAGQIIAMISTDTVDSDGDIIHQGKTEWGSGWELDRFNKHPVMLWMHDHMRPSMGKASVALETYKDGVALFAKGEFDQEDEFARQIEGKIRRGVLSETSVGFVASKYTPIDIEEPWGGYHFYQQELIEFSWVNRGANPDVESFIKSACVSCPDIGKLIKTNEDPQLVEMQEEFLARLKTLESYVLKAYLDGGHHDNILPTDAKRWDAVTSLAKQIADTQKTFRGGK